MRKKFRSKFLALSKKKKLRKATISFFASVRLSIRPHGTTRLPLDGFSRYLIFEDFFQNLSTISPPPKCEHMSFVDIVVLPPGHSRSVTDFWAWDAHKAQLRCPDDVWVVIEEDVVPGGALNLNSTNLPRPWSPREYSPSRKIPTVEPGIEPVTSWLVVRDSDH